MRDRSFSNWRGHAESLYKRFAGRRLGVATLHDKERVIGPALMGVLPLAGYNAIPDVETDLFGAFSGEVERRSDPLTTCIEKAKHGAEVSGMDLVIASEGSFGPYPPAPFISCNEEFLVLFDARDGTLFQHKHLSLETVFGGESCSTWGQVSDFAERMKFPEHQLVVRTNERWERGGVLLKGIVDRDKLRQVTQVLQVQNGSCWVETDMRAMANPTRMRVIAETSDRFATELATLCPSCSECWFRITEALPGLPCGLCGLPTRSVRAYRRTCRSCGHHADLPRPDAKLVEDPGHCDHCNP
ncbi:MAG: hypothetical protein IPO90_12505 [Flavobacteriales bacterium]|nr:hypothetical protein [Flavobacteriales bacterium]